METCYMVELQGAAVNGSVFSCEGAQIVRLIEAVAPAMGECVWFASDLSDQRDGPILIPEGERIPHLIGDSAAVVAWLKQVSQFTWAVFLAVLANTLPATWTDEIWAETDLFRDIGPASLEIRCFDSSRMYALAPECDPIQLLAEHFDASVQTPEMSS